MYLKDTWGKPMKMPAGKKKTVPAGYQCLRTHMDGSDLLSPQIPENSQVPLRKLPNKVIFTCMRVLGSLQVPVGPAHHR